MKKVGVVFPVVNQFRMAIEAMESIQTQYDWQPFIIPQWRVKKSLSGAWNQGIHQAVDAHCDYILVSNDDVLFSPWTIDGLVEEFENAPTEVCMVTAVNQRGNIEPQDIRTIEKPTIITQAESPDFSCFLIYRGFIEDTVVGEFDENVTPAYFEDNEMHIRINVLGLKAIATTAAPFYHFGSQTQNAELAENKPIVSGDAFNRNGEYVQRKWGSRDANQLNYRYPFNDPNNDPRIWKKEWRPEIWQIH
jgi:hypothetical protein